MKALFIGGTGLISTASSRLAVEKGVDLYLLNRGNRSEFAPEGAKFINADINDTEKVKEAIKEHDFDVVANWIAFTPDEIERDIELFAGKTKQYIFISSSSAYQKPVGHYLITEATPLVNPYWEYSRNKAKCEERLMQEHRENGFPFTVVRPSLTYGDTMIPFSGEGNCWSAPWSLIDRLLRGKKVLVHGDGTSLWTMTHNTDFAKGFVGLMGSLQAIGHAFHITSDEVLSWDQIMQTIAGVLGVKADIVHVPSDYLEKKMPSTAGDLLGDKTGSAVFDNSKLKRFVPGFQATVSFREGIARTIEWFKKHPERCNVDEAWNSKVDEIVEIFENL